MRPKGPADSTIVGTSKFYPKIMVSFHLNTIQQTRGSNDNLLGKLGSSEWAEWQTFPTQYIEGIHTYKLTLKKWFLLFQIDSLPSSKKSRPCG